MPVIENHIPSEVLSRFSDFIADAMGLNYPPARWPDLERGITETARELGFENAAEGIQQLMSGPLTKHRMDVLADHLTVGETYFFREPRSFEILAGTILPELIRLRQNDQRRIRIWSAACCTGEEAYTIAIVLRQTIPDLDNWNVTVLATDINPRFLRKAEAGIFGPWSFRETPAWIKQSYFRPASDGRLEILPQIKRMVSFANLNLVEDAYPSLANDTNAMDVIFCRNVLMYFTAAQAASVIEKLNRAQVQGGWLLVSATELANAGFPNYHAVAFPGATVYRKEPGKPQPTVVPPALFHEPIPPAEIVAEIKTNSLPEILSQTLPDSPSVDLVARSLANEGRLTEALACCDRWVATDKLNAPAHYLRAIILQEQGAIEDAIQSLRAAVYLDPNFVLAHFALGNVARRRGRDAEADKHLSTALRLSARYREDQFLPESDGLTAGRFAQMIHSLQNVEAQA